MENQFEHFQAQAVKPDAQEPPAAEARRTAPEERFTRFEQAYSRDSALVRRFAGAEGTEKAEAALPISDEVLMTVFGDGVPLRYVYHQMDGLTGLVAPHSIATPMGITLEEVLRARCESAEAVSAAQALVETYEKHSQRIRAKSENLRQLLVPLENEGETQITDDDLALARRLVDPFWYGHSGVERKRTKDAYVEMIEPAFGSLFRRFALNSETPEELEQYQIEIHESLKRLSASL